MRATLCFFSLLVFCASLGGQSHTPEPDPYHVDAVKADLQSRSTGPMIFSAYKHMARLGDDASIAILKILDERDLTNPEMVKRFLGTIRTSFSSPQFISREEDKKPKVTVLLLNYLRLTVPDPQTQKDIQDTLEYVKRQTSP